MKSSILANIKYCKYLQIVLKNYFKYQIVIRLKIFNLSLSNIKYLQLIKYLVGALLASSVVIGISPRKA
jgi:hypothetical protein